MDKPHPRATVAGGRAETRAIGCGRALVFLCSAAAVLLALAPCASGARSQQLIRACHKARDGHELHLVTRPNARCQHRHEELTWNKHGVVGPRGFRGFSGESGKVIVITKKSGDDSLRTILELAALSAGVALGGLLALFVLALTAMQVLSRLPIIKDTYPISRLRPPSFVVETLDDSAVGKRIGPAITGLVRSRIGLRGDRLGLDYVTGQRSVRLTLKRVKDVAASFQTPDGPTGAALAVIDFMARTLPRRRFILRGELQPAGPAGPGISLALEDPSGEDSLVVLWATPLEVHGERIACYRRLAIPAAAWADHRLTTALRFGSSNDLLTRNADSWTFFNAGLEAHRLGEDAAARSLYEEALGHDGGNIGALANLGLLERRARNFGEADRLFASAVDALEKRRGSPRQNPDWYRIRYQRAVLYLNRATWGGGRAARPGDLESALSRSKHLALESLSVIIGQTLVQRLRSAVRDRARQIWNARRHPLKTVRLGWSRWNTRRRQWTGHRTGASAKAERRAVSDFLRTTILPSALTLLAGALHETQPHFGPPPELQTFKDLQAVLENQDLDLGGEELGKFVEGLQELAPRAYYNLACYRATVKRNDDAKRWLERAVLRTTITERPALLRVVEHDETLEQVTDDPVYMERLRSYLRAST